MFRHFARALKSLSRLGLANGCALYAHYVYHRLVPGKKWTARRVRIRGVSRPVWLRPGVSDWILMERIFLDREYDPLSRAHDEAMDRLRAATLGRGRTPLIVDCGANIGLSAIWFAERFPDAVVVAVEPEPGNFAMLARNARGFPTIVPLRAAISDRNASVALTNAHGTPWAWQVRECEAGDTATVTLPEILARHPGCELLLVKVDIEGFETCLFRGATEWVDRVPLMIFEPHDWMLPWSGAGDAFIAALSRHPRDYLIRGENMFAYSHALAGPRAAEPASRGGGGYPVRATVLASAPAR